MSNTHVFVFTYLVNRLHYLLSKGGQSTMGYLEISIPTGMDADLDTLNTSQTGGLFKKSEKAFRQINLYFDAVCTTYKSSTLCLSD
jgi:hypothetical protein